LGDLGIDGWIDIEMGVDWTDLYSNKVLWWVLVNAVMKVQTP